MRRVKNILYLLAVFLFGAAGGVWAQAFLLPYMAITAPYEDWWFVEDWNERTVVLQPVERIYVGEREGIERAVESSQRVVVGVRSVQGQTLIEGSGLISAADGHIVTLASMAPQGYSVHVYLPGEGTRPVSAQVLKRDAEANLALLKVDRAHLATVSFANEQNARPGSSLFLVGRVLRQNEIRIVANEGVIRAKTNGTIETSVRELAMAQGSPVFDLQGRVLGLAEVQQNGAVHAIPSSVLRQFLERN